MLANLLICVSQNTCESFNKNKMKIHIYMNLGDEYVTFPNFKLIFIELL